MPRSPSSSARARRFVAASLLLVAGAAPAAARAQGDGPGVARRVAERMESPRGVRAYTLVQRVSGFPVTLVHERRDEARGGGWTVRPVLAEGRTLVALSARDQATLQARLPDFLREHAGRFRYERADTLRGRAVHVVWVEEAAVAGGAGARHTFWVDAAEHVPLRVVVEGRVIDAAGRPEPVASSTDLLDWRAAGGGLYLPFRTRTRIRNSSMLPPRPMAEEMRAGLDSLRARPALSADARARYDALARLLDGVLERGALELETEVREVRVEN